MLEKAKNRKILYFLILIVLGLSLICNITVATCDLESSQTTNHDGGSYPGELILSSLGLNTSLCKYPQEINWHFSGPRVGYILISGQTGATSTNFTVWNGGVQVGTGTVYSSANQQSISYVFNTDWSYSGTGLKRFDVTYGTPVIKRSDGWNYPYSGSAPFVPSFFWSDRNLMAYVPDGDWECIYCDTGYVTCDIQLSGSSGNLPYEVTFTDNSEGFPETYPYATYELSFGDGYTASGDWQYSGENWFHTYYNANTYNYSYKISYDGISYYHNGSIVVSDTSSNYEVTVHGLNTAPIEGANVSIWYNGEYQDSEGSSSIGTAYFTIPPYRFVNGSVTKPGYQTAYFDTYIYPDDNFETVTLYLDNETAGSGDSYGNYIVTFKNAVTGENVGYSNIEVYSDSGYTTLFYDEYSNSGGVWSGLIPIDVVYYYKYPETTGYYSQSWSYNLTSSPSYKTVNLVPKSGATSTTTPTPTTITTTITPTVTYTYNNSNLSALNVKERFTNLLVLAGFQNAESADLIFAMIIVLGCTALIGWITLSGSGAGMGAIIGFVFSLGLGLIPLWLLIAAIFFGCLYVALKLFGGSGE